MRTAHVCAHLHVFVEEGRHRPPHRDRSGRSQGASLSDSMPSVVHSARNVRTSVRKPFVDRTAPAANPASDPAVDFVFCIALEKVLDRADPRRRR
jgi:hypothetical protein